MRHFILLAAAVATALAQDTQSGVPVRIVVTAEGHHDKTPPPVTASDVQIMQGKDRPRVADWTALTGDRAGLQLAVLIDDGADSDLGNQFGDLRSFITAQPVTTLIAIDYMRNGTLLVAQDFTNDHDRAAKALRLPIGRSGAGASPYFSLEDLAKRWPDFDGRREVLMISSGIDPFYGGFDPQNPYLVRAVESCQRAGILVHSIYYPSGGHLGHSSFRSNWGQNYLSLVGDQTGGEPYWQGFGAPVSFQPFLKDLSMRLNNQYLLTFRSRSERKAGFQNFRLRTELPGVELISADRVYVPAER